MDSLYNPKIYISLTTIPSRIPNLNRTINSLLSQSLVADKIIINIPNKYHRFPENPIIPNFLLENNKIIINRCPDFGPGTKLLGLLFYQDIRDDDILIICDDDRNYDHHFVLDLYNNINKYPDYAITIAGWEIEKMSSCSYDKKNLPRGIEYHSDGFIDILGGCCGFAVKYKFITKNIDILDINPNDYAFYVDDVWISGHLTNNNVKIWMISNKGDASRNINNSIDALANIGGKYNRNDCNQETIKYFIKKYNIWKK